MDLAVSVEYAKSSRATCGRCKRPIMQGSVRIGKQYSQDHSGETKYHLACFKHKSTTSAKDTLFGFEKLKPSDQTTVTNAWEKQGPNAGATTTTTLPKPTTTTPTTTTTTTSSPFTMASTTKAAKSYVPEKPSLPSQTMDPSFSSRIDNYIGLGMLTDEQAAWMLSECPRNPKAYSILKSAIEMYEFDRDRDEFVDTIHRLVTLHMK
mmetsp:Transcript_33848/g.46327  ORF Transcript_33848/g.46327 Transcript_33848/m.46327 type:complete len:207 (-) Transcript_33848:30-650(-)|eukprot:CAMPEP_0201492402 /NCGR_PEP_ID=MMETSP0151_2-20130828/32952_1 /ASSEMBLY_ACC=CAM_ASM_000257 /TAXON_ID=200890 /ORGANISM="Paramoeba atlantica, Strain 621/1 / CCAP 1560/9" /LENGTH=206 /DNA_ID=CAMNT_0047879191 /DNA_START=41 /DNA_END=664 /DNA_ORIENTATION=+